MYQQEFCSEQYISSEHEWEYIKLDFDFFEHRSQISGFFVLFHMIFKHCGFLRRQI